MCTTLVWTREDHKTENGDFLGTEEVGRRVHGVENHMESGSNQELFLGRRCDICEWSPRKQTKWGDEN